MLQRGLARRCDEDGAAAVEFALVAALLVMLALGIASFGLAYFQYQGLQAAAREGARLGSLPNMSAGEVETRVRHQLVGVLSDNLNDLPTDLDIKVKPCVDAATEDDSVQVTVSLPVQLLIPILNEDLLNRNLEAYAEFRCESFEGG